MRVDRLQDFTKTDRFVLWLSRNWVWGVSLVLGLYVLAPFTAPFLMSIGWIAPAKAIYWVYSFLCHQLPERSYFLLGPKISYTLPEIQIAWQNTDNIAILRQFVGNAQMGWKVAWSDRMVSMFTSLWIFGMFWGVFRKKIKTLPWWGFILLVVPIVIDGTTHMVSDVAGLGQGFRDTNTWLAALTNNSLPSIFYAGDAWGSFNAWMRLITGLLFGLGTVWFCYPLFNEAFANSAALVEYKVQYRTWLKREKARLAKLSSSDGSQPDGYSGCIQHIQEGEINE